ncbi:hypothetical protein [Mesorhizobium atlanticum]|uniref:hypothetical protein n=1 Tax=Mesorhizobium atlanticum TaxID=2233532 RepID=UPI000DD3890F|nr:hypothetical protein [Mesorhizobium atlanticum]
MQKATGLLAILGDSIEAIKSYLATIDQQELENLLGVLPSRSPAGSAEMVMRILVYREIEKRESDDPPRELH